MKTKEEKTLSIYVHIPFCKQKCLYCDFLSAPASKQEQEVYVKALVREIEREALNYREYQVDTLFLGGGTPSILSKEQMEEILLAIKSNYNLCKEAGITMECNPATADDDKMKAFVKCGVNRISIGLQTADEKQLKCLGRIHNYRDFLETFRCARNAGIHNINVDIMQALPGQDMDSCKETLEKVMALKPEHISVYSLIIEEGTPFYDMTLDLPDEDTEREMYHTTCEMLEQNGYLRYEISNYAKPGFDCKHNVVYWTGADYVGFGIGAASYVNGCRFKNIEDRTAYINLLNKEEPISAIREQTQVLSENGQMEEFMFLGLRMMQGVSKEEFLTRFKKNMEDVYGAVLKKHMEQNLLECHNGRYYLTKKGIDVSNYVMSDFILDD